MNLILVFNSPFIVRLFTDSTEVVELIRIPALIYGLTAPFIFATNIYLFAMPTVGLEKESMNLFFIQNVAIAVPLFIYFIPWGFQYCISAQPISEVAGGIITLCWKWQVKFPTSWKIKIPTLNKKLFLLPV